jgi:hypothetical protein
VAEKRTFGALSVCLLHRGKLSLMVTWSALFRVGKNYCRCRRAGARTSVEDPVHSFALRTFQAMAHELCHPPSDSGTARSGRSATGSTDQTNTRTGPSGIKGAVICLTSGKIAPMSLLRRWKRIGLSP